MDAMSDPAVEVVVCPKAAQVGWTAMLGNVLGYHMHQDPSSVMFLLPTLEMAEAWSTERFSPMVRDTPVLSNLVGDPRSRDSGNKILNKKFPGGYIAMVGANSPASLSARPVRILLGDEVDRYPYTAGEEGDPLTIAIKRQTNYWNRKRLLGSTPKLRISSVIWREWERSDKRLWHVPCPNCQAPQVLNWSQVQWDKDKVSEPDPVYGEHLPDTARYVCEACGDEWDDGARWSALAEGEWRATAPFRGIAGFHISAFMSPWVTLEAIVREFLEGRHDPLMMQVWVNTTLGEPWEDQGARPDDDALLGRLETWAPPAKHGELALAPARVRKVTCGVDTQPDRLEVERVGWAEGEESWSLDYRVFHGDPSEPEVWAELWEYLLTPTETLGGRVVEVAATAVDSGGSNTQAVYNWCNHRDRQRRKVYAIKGQGGERPVWPERATKLKHGRGHLWVIGVDSAKDRVYSALRIRPPEGDEPRPGFCHFPVGRSKDYFAQLTAERVVTRWVKGRPIREYVKRPHQRNEALDVRVYAYAALLSLKVNWTREAKRFTLPARDPEPATHELAGRDRAPPPAPLAPAVAVAKATPPPERKPAFGRRVTRSAFMGR